MKILANTHSAHSIDDGCGSFRLLAIVEPGLLAHQRPQLVQVDGGAVGCVPLKMVMSHSHLTKVPRMAEETQERTEKVNCSLSRVRSQQQLQDINWEIFSCVWQLYIG